MVLSRGADLLPTRRVQRRTFGAGILSGRHLPAAFGAATTSHYALLHAIQPLAVLLLWCASGPSNRNGQSHPDLSKGPGVRFGFPCMSCQILSERVGHNTLPVTARKRSVPAACSGVTQSRSSRLGWNRSKA